MPEDTDTRTRAVNIVRQIIADGGGTLDLADPAMTANVTSLIDAVEGDLIAADHAHADLQDTEERLLKVEVQTRLLSEAVVAIADPGLAVAPAIKAVKNGM